MKFFLCAKGLPYFAFPEKIKAYLLKVYQIPDSTLRIFGFFSVAMGLILVYFGRN
jgi:uncharacterized protein YjeT (DUF2065 family)